MHICVAHQKINVELLSTKVLDIIHLQSSYYCGIYIHTQYRVPLSNVNPTVLSPPQERRAGGFFFSLVDLPPSAADPSSPTPTSTQPRITTYSSRWYSSYPPQPFSASVFLILQCHQLGDDSIPNPLFSIATMSQYLATNPRFSSFNLPLHHVVQGLLSKDLCGKKRLHNFQTIARN